MRLLVLKCWSLRAEVSCVRRGHGYSDWPRRLASTCRPVRARDILCGTQADPALQPDRTGTAFVLARATAHSLQSLWAAPSPSEQATALHAVANARLHGTQRKSEITSSAQSDLPVTLFWRRVRCPVGNLRAAVRQAFPGMLCTTLQQLAPSVVCCAHQHAGQSRSRLCTSTAACMTSPPHDTVCSVTCSPATALWLATLSNNTPLARGTHAATAGDQQASILATHLSPSLLTAPSRGSSSDFERNFGREQLRNAPRGGPSCHLCRSRPLSAGPW